MNKKITIMPAGIQFDAQASVSVLQSALNAGYSINYSCMQGDCNECEAILLQGSMSTLKGQVIDQSNILTCMCMPETDCIIEAEYYPELDDVKRIVVAAKVDEINFPTLDVAIILFRLPPTTNLKYLAGQYVELSFDGITRSYSVANSPCSLNKIELHVKRVDGGAMSEKVFNAWQKNTLVRLTGPVGTFFVRESKHSLVFLVTGTGFAPVKAVVEDLINKDDVRQIYIYWGGRTEIDFYSKLPLDWQASHKNITFIPVLSCANSDWQGRNGYIQNAMVKDFSEYSAIDVYACGSPAMIADAKALLINKGLPKKQFYSDAFIATTA